MRNEQNQNGLDNLLTEAMVELPERLRERLQRIPAPARQIDWSVPLMVIFLAPLLIWGGWQLAPHLAGWLTGLAENPWSFAVTSLGFGGQHGWFALAGLVGVVLFVFVAVRDRAVWG